MQHYQVFGEKVIIEPGMNIVGTRFVNKKSQAQDCQKQKHKSRLIAQGYKEIKRAQSDNPTANKE